MPPQRQKQRRAGAGGRVAETRERQLTFSKRKKGLFKKASDLCVLTGARVRLEIVSESGRRWAKDWPSSGLASTDDARSEAAVLLGVQDTHSVSLQQQPAMTNARLEAARLLGIDGLQREAALAQHPPAAEQQHLLPVPATDTVALLPIRPTEEQQQQQEQQQEPATTSDGSSQMQHPGWIVRQRQEEELAQRRKRIEDEDGAAFAIRNFPDSPHSLLLQLLAVATTSGVAAEFSWEPRPLWLDARIVAGLEASEAAAEAEREALRARGKSVPPPDRFFQGLSRPTDMSTPRTFTLVGFDEDGDDDSDDVHVIFPTSSQARVFLTRVPLTRVEVTLESSPTPSFGHVPPEYAHYRVMFHLIGAGDCVLQYAIHQDLWNVMADPDSPFRVPGMLMSVGELAIARFKHEFALMPGQPVDPLLRTLIRGLVLPTPKVSTSAWLLSAVDVTDAFWDAAAQCVHNDHSRLLPCCQGANEAYMLRFLHVV